MSDVLIIADTFPPNRGGSENYLSVIAEGLCQLGHKVLVHTPATDSTGSYIPSSNLTVKRSTIWKKLQVLGGHANPWLNRLARLLLFPFLTLLIACRRHDVVIAGHIVPGG